MLTVALLKRMGFFFLALVFFFGGSALNAATDAPPTAQILDKILTAIAINNYDALVANAAPALKARITKETFTQVTSQLSPRLKKGYKPDYLGSLRQQGVEVFLWKIIFLDGGDDLLINLVMQENMVAGFWFE